MATWSLVNNGIWQTSWPATGWGPQCFSPATPLLHAAWQTVCRLYPYGHHQGCSHWGCPDTGRARGGNLLPSGTGGSAHPRGKAAGRLLGPLPPDLAGDGQVSRIGLIPKPHKPGKWRLIVDLSSLHGNSVNDAISSDLCHMHYTSVLEAATIIRQLGNRLASGTQDGASSCR